MKKDSILIGVIGLLLGLIIGFMFANNINQRGNAVAVAQQNQALPPDHPPITSNNAQSGPDMQSVQEAINQAKSDQTNFAAQMKAADYAYQVQRYDEAIQFLQRANQLQPGNYEAIVQLGNVNFDANRFEEAEKWYAAALKMKPDDVNVRTDLGLTFLLREPANLDRAITEFRASLERDSKHLQTLQNLTVALTRKGDAAQARIILAKLEEVSPG
ncbi:MAG TPA: tetratricopeptide repeat protein, partial [Pyrinomonadaceae bacterium]|nr:tetratricopeptide repeat protein [Pyrinomonadaceae bacterium]